VVRVVILIVALVGTFGMNMNVLIPVYARDLLQVGAEGYGFLSSAMGVGSLLAALLLAYLGQAPRRTLVLGSAVALGLLQILLAGIQQYLLAVVVLAGLGFAMIVFTTLSNTALQLSTPDALRGRVMSVFTTVFVGSTPIGSLFVGALAQQWGVGAAFIAGGLISVIAALIGIPLSRGVRRR
jgi:MFS family permease